MKVILDTNVVVSALLSPSGLPARILNFVLDGSITIVYDNNILAEYADVLNREKFKIDKGSIELVMDFITKEGDFRTAGPKKIKLYEPQPRPRGVEPQVRGSPINADDAMFYTLYNSDGIDYLITGNIKHFPHEKGIVTPRKFLERE